MTLTPNPSNDRYAHLRGYAAQQKRATVERLQRAIAQLVQENRPVSTFTLKEVSGLDYMTYYRNAEALALFRRHSTHLRKEREKAQAQRRGSKQAATLQEALVPSRDPLLNYKKPHLVTALRTARAERDRMEQQYQTLLQEHIHCGLTIARLETQLAEYQAFLERFRSSLQKEEHGPQS